MVIDVSRWRQGAGLFQAICWPAGNDIYSDIYALECPRRLEKALPMVGRRILIRRQSQRSGSSTLSLPRKTTRSRLRRRKAQLSSASSSRRTRPNSADRLPVPVAKPRQPLMLKLRLMRPARWPLEPARHLIVALPLPLPHQRMGTQPLWPRPRRMQQQRLQQQQRWRLWRRCQRSRLLYLLLAQMTQPVLMLQQATLKGEF